MGHDYKLILYFDLLVYIYPRNTYTLRVQTVATTVFPVFTPRTSRKIQEKSSFFKN